ncbi:MAG: hypothetical protein KJ069_09080 [Anaerolineae bacterium]|nr:hypothetical protein [Anaerolineae bacterium]
MKVRRTILLMMLLLLLLAAGIWVLPFSGHLFIMLDEQEQEWPRLHLQPESPRPGEQATLIARDTTPWVHVKLMVNDETEAIFTQAQQTPLGWEWQWRFIVPDTAVYDLILYHDCDRGCREWARKSVSNVVNTARYPATQTPTKLCAVFPYGGRDWHGRAAWTVELTYAQQADSLYWGVDDVAQRVAAATHQGHRVLLRVEYDQNQTMPPPDDTTALAVYLEYVRRLARDDRFRGVYAFVIGDGFNSREHNQQTPDNPVTPAWYARVLSGYGTAVTDQDNVLSIVRAENPGARVLVGAVQPWVLDEVVGVRPSPIDAPWLNYMHTLVTLLDETAQARAAAGIPLAIPDGFAVDAPGNPESAKMDGLDPALEPQTDLISTTWHGAQLGFRVYQDWLDIINSGITTHGLPVYIVASNTYGADSTGPPAQTYPNGWLTQALAEINNQPQVQSLCWFVDYFPYSNQWADFSLTTPVGGMAEAAAEFDALLRLDEEIGD